MFRCILIGLIFLSCSMFSHSMQPINMEGTEVSSAYFNSDINVLSEAIDIDVSEHFREARYTVRYEIYSKQAGSKIPLLFALYNDNNAVETVENNVALSITIDGHPAAIQKIASGKTEISFDRFFEGYQTEPDDYRMYRVKDSGNGFPDHVSFIKADLSVGYHTIVATYNAVPSYRDTNRLTYQYSYDYSFDPIKLKQDFTNTTVNLNFDGAIEDVSFQMFPDSKQGLTNSRFIFKETLPEAIKFSYQRQFPSWVKMLVKGPALGFFIIFYVLFAWWHIKEVKKLSAPKPSSILGYVLIASIFIPFISIIAYTLYRWLAYFIIKAQVIEDMLIIFGFLGYVMLFLLLAPFYSAFIYYRYYKNKEKSF